MHSRSPLFLSLDDEAGVLGSDWVCLSVALPSDQPVRILEVGLVDGGDRSGEDERSADTRLGEHPQVAEVSLAPAG